MAITLSGDSPNLTSASLTTPTLTSPTFAGTPTGVGVLTSGTAVDSTSGTSIDFTSIPSWVKRVNIIFSSVSTNGTSLFMLQIGNGSIVTTGYESGSWTANTANTGSTAGFILNAGSSASSGSYHGVITVNLISANKWVESGTLGQSTNPASIGGGSVSGGTITLGGTLDRVRITTVNGTDTFDAGSINILYE